MLLIPLVLKASIILLLARLMGATTGVAMRTGLYLAQAGEFGFVLLNPFNVVIWIISIGLYFARTKIEDRVLRN